MSGYRSGGNPSRLITKSNTAGQSLLGNANLTGNNATTSWGQVIASLGADTVLTKVYVYSNADRPLVGQINTVEIGIGGAGSEVSIATEPFTTITTLTTNFAAVVEFSPPLRIASGQRVAARVTTPSTMNGSPVSVVVYSIPYANVESV